MAANPKDDKELIAAVRGAVGATNEGEVPHEKIRLELDDVKHTVSTEVQRALNQQSINLYEGDAPLQIARHLLSLRVEELKREATRGPRPPGERGPDKIPRGVGALRRHKFEDKNLRFHRDEAVRHLNRLTNKGNGNGNN